MAQDVRAQEIPFAEAREQVERALEKHLSAVSGGLAQAPRFELEKGNVTFHFSPPSLSEAFMFQALAVIKQHIEHVRVHTFEPGYVIFQSMGDNLYDTSAFAQGMKFRFGTMGGAPKVEISRRANLTQDELLACINVFRLLVPSGGDVGDPLERFAQLGVTLYSREEHGSDREFIAGYKQTRLEIKENVILPLTRPEVFRSVARITRGHDGADIVPRAVLFEGPPGVGKTTMARLIAREVGIPLVYVPIENILSKYYGESAQNLAAVFDAAASMERVILFLDEIDSLAGSREGGLFEATRRLLSVLLRKIEGFESREGVLTIGATNRSQDLDHALVSRFDQIITFPLPNAEERAAIFGGYAVQLSKEDCARLGEVATGLSGRNIRDICEAVERRWVRRLIAEGAPDPSAPPPALYRELVSERVVPRL